jgi:hypothetical protein
MSITYCECLFIAIGIQHAMGRRNIILLFFACPSLQYVSTLSHMARCLGKVTEQKMCVLIFSTNFV